jgi:hypothetical protein
MNVLIACEFSGIVRDAFKKRGHNAWSCDLLPSEHPGGQHLEGNVMWWLTKEQIKLFKWDLIIAHPPCTYLANSGVRWLYQGGRGRIRDLARWKEMKKAAVFFTDLLNAKVPKIAVENPIMHCHALKITGIKPSQIIQPWQFGHGETKATCLWLKNLPLLKSTKVVPGRLPRVHHAAPSPNRWKERSRTLQGIADAMATQWG